MKQKLWTKDFLSICFSSFFIFITFYSLSATLPTFVTDELGGDQQQAGWAMTAFVIAAVIMRPFAGRWLDGSKRRTVLLLSIALFMASMFAYSAVAGFGLLLLLRFVHGLSFGVATTGNGAVAIELVPKERKGEGMGYYTLAMNLAMVLGPFLGLLIVEHSGYNLLFVVFSVLAALGMVLGFVANIPKPRPAPAGAAPAFSKWHWRSFVEPKAIPIAITSMLMAFAYAGILTFVPVYAKEIGMSSVASYYFVVYAVMIVLSRPFTGKLFDKISTHYLVYPTILLYAVGLVVLSAANNPFVFLLSAALIGLGFGTMAPILQTIAVQASPAHRTAMATGTYFIFFDGGVGIGSVVLGSIAASAGNRRMYLASAAVVACGALVYYFLTHRKARLADRTNRPAKG
ncbi:MFS transporter [Cohnella massiliensis]|uniref:MFS transporter n=2 Tax=Cohnella TaxID=329857 RepID=UPI0009BAB888|nr:MFS transporter [Cohnella massiliensis]